MCAGTAAPDAPVAGTVSRTEATAAAGPVLAPGAPGQAWFRDPRGLGAGDVALRAGSSPMEGAEDEDEDEGEDDDGAAASPLTGAPQPARSAAATNTATGVLDRRRDAVGGAG